MASDLGNISIHQPHDSLFKEAFKNKEVATDFLKSRLEPAILKRVDLATLKPEDASFVDKRLAKRYSDLVFSAEMDGKKGYLYFLIELQVEDDKDIALRVLEYNVRLMRKHVAQGSSKLPAIINFVLYAGKTPYRGNETILEAFEYPDLFLESLQRKIILDLTKEDDNKLLRDKKAALAEWAIKWAYKRDFCNIIKNIKFDLGAMINESPYGISLVLYMLNRERHEADKLLEKIDELDETRKENIMNALEQIERKGIRIGRQEGREEGRQEGRGEGRQKAILELLRKGIITKEVAEEMLKNKS